MKLLILFFLLLLIIQIVSADDLNNTTANEQESAAKLGEVLNMIGQVAGLCLILLVFGIIGAQTGEKKSKKTMSFGKTWKGVKKTYRTSKKVKKDAGKAYQNFKKLENKIKSFKRS